MNARLRRLVFHGDAFINLFKAHEDFPGFVRVVKNALPDDAHVVRTYNDSDGRMILVVSSATFDEVPNGGMIPEHPATQFDRVYVTPTSVQSVPT